MKADLRCELCYYDTDVLDYVCVRTVLAREAENVLGV